MKTRIKYVLLIIILLFLDQITKYMAARYLYHPDGPTVVFLIPGVISLQYLENYGAAFGMLQGQKIFFVFITCIAVFLMGWVWLKLKICKRYQPLHLILTFLFAGAVGNFIDRIRNGYVIDFICAEFIDFPIFNVADIYVTCGAIAFLFVFLFYYKEEDITAMEHEILPWKKGKKSND